VPVPADDSAFSDVESRELPRDLAPGTARKLCEFPHCDAGDETLCGDVGLLSLLSNEFAARSSTGVDRCWDGCDSCDGCDEGSVTVPLAEVSIVIVGARCLRPGPGEGVWRPLAPISSAMWTARKSNAGPGVM